MPNDPAPIDPGDTVSSGALNRIYQGMRDCTLPKNEWTHGAHLVFGCALLTEKGLRAAEQEMPDLIRTYNESVGGVNSDTEGYHHTITSFYLRALDQFLTDYPDMAASERATAVLNSPLAVRDYPLTYYSKELLFSIAARRGWVEPDLKPIA